jgi:phage/conjugal plasmid C-4 type zinc finger TraR family protein
MDLADRAQVVEEDERAAALARALPPVPARPSAQWCETCGERIPDARQQAVPGVQLCADCQTREERRRWITNR